jgi:U3 small nucleolar ribonucleoprotein component
MDLKKLMVDTKSVWVDFPGLKGFSVEVANLSRKELNSLRKRCTAQKFDRKTRQVIEEINEEKFVQEFSIATVKNWKGLTLEHLETLLLIDTNNQDMSKELDYSEENAETLVSSSTEFDTWLNEVVFDLDNFRAGPKGRSLEEAGEALQES